MAYEITPDETNQLTLMQRELVIIQQQIQILELQMPQLREAAQRQIIALKNTADQIQSKYEWAEFAVFNLQSLKFEDKG